MKRYLGEREKKINLTFEKDVTSSMINFLLFFIL